MKIIFIKLKRNIIPLLFFLFTICLIVFSKSNIQAVKSSLDIWVNNVIPSLFPFFIATELLNHTNIPRIIGNLFNKIMRPLFNVPGIGAYALFMGIISGYPVGAKIVTNFRNQNSCTKEEAERLISFTNNSCPLFILGTVGISLFYDSSIGLLLLFTHILACITVGIIFRFIGLPYWLVCGIIATVAVIVEHLLTVYPFGILSKIFIGECEGKEKCKE